jgi:hypothetical protein
MNGGLRAQAVIKGRVMERGADAALPFVHIALQTQDSVFITGTASDSAGYFLLEGVTAGDCRLTFSFTGFGTQCVELKGLKDSVTIADVWMTEEATGLEEVTVTGSGTTARMDRMLIFPSAEQVRLAGNGTDLLQALMLPRLQVHPLTREVSVPGGGEVQLRINDVPVEAGDITALRPADIVRVEYHDSPGMRYGGAAVAVNFIVRHHKTGGSMGVNVKNSLKLRTLGEHGFRGRFNYGSSEVAVNCGISYRDYLRMWREYEETFRLPDGSVLHRKEESRPGGLQWLNQWVNVMYGYRNERRTVTATVRYAAYDTKRELYRARLYDVAAPELGAEMTDNNIYAGYRPSLDVYYQENIGQKGTLVVNMVGTYLRTDRGREYSETRDSIVLTDINNTVEGRRRSWIGEAVYERKAGAGALSAGVHHIQAWTDNTYRNGGVSRTDMRQADTRLYAEWKSKAGALDYRTGVSVVRMAVKQAATGTDYDSWMFNPRFAFLVTLRGSQSLRLTGSMQNVSPSLSDLSAVEQAVDSLRIQRGNAALTPYLMYRSELTYEVRHRALNASLRGVYERRPSAVMEEYFWEAGRVVRTFGNQKYWEWMNAQATVRVGPVKDVLTLSAFGGVNRYASAGNTYRHTCVNPFVTLKANVTWRNFGAYFEWIESWNRFEGETMYGGENMHVLNLTYRYRDMHFGAGAFNPFAANFHMDGENRSKEASWRRSFHNGEFARLLLFTFAWDVQFGRTFRPDGKRIANSDDDAGIMNAGK